MSDTSLRDRRGRCCVVAAWAAARVHMDQLTATPGACTKQEECSRATKHEDALKVQEMYLLFPSLLIPEPCETLGNCLCS